jgi:hypothetical protein
VGHSSGSTATSSNDHTGANQSSKDPNSMKQYLNDATGANHNTTMGVSVDSAGSALSSKEHYKKTNNSLKILVVMCHG